MSEQQTLKKSLIAAFEHLKAQDALISVMRCELAALRGASFENNVEALVRFEELLAIEVTGDVPKIAMSARVFDSIIQLLKADARWIN